MEKEMKQRTLTTSQPSNDLELDEKLPPFSFQLNSSQTVGKETPTFEFWQKIMHDQPTINLMTIGHVSNGKSTLMKALSGENLAKFHNEKKRNMTIKLGYTSVKIFECESCPRPDCYIALPSTSQEKKIRCEKCNSKVQLIRHFSFVDCPGHASLMGTMLCGASVVDGAILVVNASKKCPLQQTNEHLSASRLLGLANNVVVAQNKIDLVNVSRACLSFDEIRNLLKSYQLKSPIIPICAQSKLNIDVLCMALIDHIPLSNRDINGPLRMSIIRSFDVNKSGQEIDDLVGGVAGVVIIQGTLQIGQKLEIRPGLVHRNGKVYPIYTSVRSIMVGRKKLKIAYPGANIGVGLSIDPFLTRSNRMVGHMIGQCQTLPNVFRELIVLFQPIGTFEKFSNKETVKINIGAFSGIGRIVSKKVKLNKHIDRSTVRNAIHIRLNLPCCAEIGCRVSMTQNINRGKLREEASWRLIGGGVIFKTKPLPLFDVNKME